MKKISLTLVTLTMSTYALLAQEAASDTTDASVIGSSNTAIIIAAAAVLIALFPIWKISALLAFLARAVTRMQGQICPTCKNKIHNSDVCPYCGYQFITGYGCFPTLTRIFFTGLFSYFIFMIVCSFLSA